MLQGSITALVTPFRDGAVDQRAFQDFVAWQIAEGTQGLVPVGTTGESPTLSHDEHKRVVELCVEVAKGKVPVIAGAGSNSTAEAVDFTRHAVKTGADAVLVVTPYYNKPTQEGLYQHFKAVAGAAGDLPVIIYNIPGRSIVDMSVETMARLAHDLPNIKGVKDATADLARPLKTRVVLGPEFIQLSGEDATATAFLAQGGVGCISVTSNVAPRLCAEMQRSWREGDLATCFAIRDKLMPLHDAMFCETSPGPVKYAVSLLGKGSAETRLPMVPISEASRKKVEEALRATGLLA
ncbi:4-hydroxy-tetrahydrodipicolinate synthase [Rhodospirillum rubrum]|uniref:4-hydroxy-tetrahydrodipicolinate synthase n=1 Tax=Rhodospirillum rubrum (strain ATCC 11170 / ATH 1.1.1 / DSM 467 / LMG 4362 / NCIMB 8255 / S1) TaxID=269796 RepID=Q2RT80_RHORT|nr:4-hydroxy-tetrahydrodipicolinate synthase [Rhodospirillum rubrum]ABC22665.1 dihydrodipicolinate synthase [Rhodospirillum rubrum ATCC 11170]AEO48383.1 dihydrodipicolinate synthase [Rhodospirillum rubrum F11]MBK5954262.1 4-hydroxy-tetrahydrodipicolinate synthase [Rhodospirillum rubrum]QXG82286.1 4-hydroxy-tetrahydrodipicolinate synthase [Rhodospirillum rubrum]HAP98462.1 4-hydroxy-tetrahydrodipicolinate synthase [Rhodospirillum rubrum]